MRIVLALCIAGILSSAAHADEAANDAAYKAIIAMTTVVPRDEKSDDCKVFGTVDFDKFSASLAVFRDAFLNRDFSIDFYSQRRKQVLSYVVLKRAAELLTEGMYNGSSAPECRFSLSVSYPDKYGQDRHFEALTWRFNDAQAGKVNWAKFDPRDFNEVALDYDVKAAVTTWTSDEPQMSEAKAPEPEAECDMTLFRANAMFFRATTFCGKDYLDSKAGLAALAGAKKCSMSDGESRSAAKEAMLSFDRLLKQRGRSVACALAETIERNINGRSE